MIRTVLASSAAMGLVFAPVAAQAGATSSAAISKSSAPHTGSARPPAIGSEQKLATGLMVAVVVAAGAATYGRVKALNNKLARSD